jgi:DNA repair exonuclease SbcCD ATPase subunit
MITLEYLELRNFMSFGNNTTTVDLTDAGTSLIIGQNLDNGGANGVGKTTIFNGICFALFNNPFDKISLKRLINNTNSEKNTLMEVRLGFKKDEKSYEIYRCRGNNTNIQITCDGVDITLDSVSENDKMIVDLIGISYELFTNIVVFSGSSEPFLQKSVGDQRKLIEELFNITILSEKAKKLKEKIKVTESDIKVQEAITKEQQNAIVRYNKQVTDAENRIIAWEDDKESNIKRIKEKLESIDGIDFESEKKKHEELKSISDCVKTLRRLFSDIESKLKDNSKSIQKNENELSHLKDSKCPFCKQQYAEAKDKVVEYESKLNELNETRKSLTEDFEKAEAELKDAEELEQEIKKSITYKNFNDLLNVHTDAEVLRQKLISLEKSENPHMEAFESLISSSIKEVDTSVIDELKARLENQQFLLKLLTDKNSFIRRKIINKTIPVLNNRLNYYTSELGLPHVIKFDDDMSCTVSEYGRELDFGNLSNGEKKRVNISLSFAFRDVLHHLHNKINLLFVDEIDTGLDTPGVEKTISLLKKKSFEDQLGIWIVMHRLEAEGRFDREITVIKENGFSRITM